MPQQFLHRANVVTVFEQMRREAGAQRVALTTLRHWLCPMPSACIPAPSARVKSTGGARPADDTGLANPAKRLFGMGVRHSLEYDTQIPLA